MQWSRCQQLKHVDAESRKKNTLIADEQGEKKKKTVVMMLLVLAHESSRAALQLPGKQNQVSASWHHARTQMSLYHKVAGAAGEKTSGKG